MHLARDEREEGETNGVTMQPLVRPASPGDQEREEADLESRNLL